MPIPRTVWTLLIGGSGVALLVLAYNMFPEVKSPLVIIGIVQLGLALAPWILPSLWAIWRHKQEAEGLRRLRIEQPWRTMKSAEDEPDAADPEEELKVWEEVSAQLGWTRPLQMTYYDILGVRSNATQDEIRAAYRERIRLFHPDRFMNQPEHIKKPLEEMSKRLNEAYEVLSDPNKGKEYDNELR